MQFLRNPAKWTANQINKQFCFEITVIFRLHLCFHASQKHPDDARWSRWLFQNFHFERKTRQTTRVVLECTLLSDPENINFNAFDKAKWSTRVRCAVVARPKENEMIAAKNALNAHMHLQFANRYSEKDAFSVWSWSWSLSCVSIAFFCFCYRLESVLLSIFLTSNRWEGNINQNLFANHQRLHEHRRNCVKENFEKKS